MGKTACPYCHGWGFTIVKCEKKNPCKKCVPIHELFKEQGNIVKCYPDKHTKRKQCSFCSCNGYVKLKNEKKKPKWKRSKRR